MLEKKKKLTNAQLEHRLKNAIIHVDKTSDYKGIFFSDKGVRLEVVEDACVISTSFHRHVFSNITSSGMSRPYLYTLRVIEIALENDCEVAGEGYSYHRLLEVLKSKEDAKEYNIVMYYEWWLMNIYSPLYTIGESLVESFFVCEEYLHNLARSIVLLEERTADVTNVEFLDKMLSVIKEMASGLEEHVLLAKKSEEELLQENIDAMSEQENEDFIKEHQKNRNDNGSKD